MKNDDTGSSTFDKTGCWQPPITTPLPKSFECRASRLTAGLMSTHMLPDCQSLVGRRQSQLECRPSGDLIVGRRIVARRTVSRSTWYRPLVCSCQSRGDHEQGSQHQSVSASSTATRSRPHRIQMRLQDLIKFTEMASWVMSHWSVKIWINELTVGLGLHEIISNDWRCVKFTKMTSWLMPPRAGKI